MFFTLAGNRRRIEDAAAKARAEGIAIGREEVRQEARRQARQELADWYEAAKAEVAAGRIPGPPPILLENGGGNAPY